MSRGKSRSATTGKSNPVGAVLAWEISVRRGILGIFRGSWKLLGRQEKPMADSSDRRTQPSRRGFLKSVGAAAVAAETLLDRVSHAAEAGELAAANGVISGSTRVVLKVNGKDRPVVVEPRTTLLSRLARSARTGDHGAQARMQRCNLWSVHGTAEWQAGLWVFGIGR